MVKRVSKRIRGSGNGVATAEKTSTPVDEAPKRKKRRAAVNLPKVDEEADQNSHNDGATKELGDAQERVKVAETEDGLFRRDVSFVQLGLAKWLVQSCDRLGMHYPTEIQARSIPPILDGKHVAGNAKTGSGKTACYALPILHSLSKDPYGIFALVLTPVRELAFQVTETFRALGNPIKVTLLEVVGGREMLFQSASIVERRHVVVATPGRLADLLRGDPELTRSFRRLRVFVLDEADRVLQSTFEDDLAEILLAIPRERQTLMFSATVTKTIESVRDSLAEQGKELLFIDANPGDDQLQRLTQQYVFMPATVRLCYLHYLLMEHFAGQSCIIFTATIDECQLVATMLDLLKLSATCLHSMQTQRRRLAGLTKFRGGISKILVATDVAGRGLDIPKVQVVLNLGLPQECDEYVHRAGRTARAGRPGLVVTLVSERDVQRVHEVEARIGRQLELLPTKEDAALKLLSKTTKVKQKAELLLFEVGFDEKVAEHRANWKKPRNGGEERPRKKRKESKT